jgi:hypothetical protein
LELFDYLVERSQSDDPPKEIEIALAVFGKTDAGAVKDDPVARVYIHRLRRRLDDYYLRDGASHDVRLVLPKGEYRIRGREVGAGMGETYGGLHRRTLIAMLWAHWKTAAAALVGALVLANFAAWVVVIASRDHDAARLRGDPVWARLVDGDRPVMIVVGDYYMFGESDDGQYLNRLVRDFAINSRADLLASQRDKIKGDSAPTRTAVDIKYLPTSTAYALTRVMRVMPDNRDVRVTLASEISPEMLRDFDIIYVGLVSGLGALREPAFTASRFAVGASYDDLVDTKTSRHYESEELESAPFDGMHRDYGFVARFPGPRGNEVLILAGERDAALAGVADSVTRPQGLHDLHASAGSGAALEALYEIQGQRHVSLSSAVIAAAPRAGASAWSTLDKPPQFPSE